MRLAGNSPSDILLFHSDSTVTARSAENPRAGADERTQTIDKK
jgi:hypothetical protein